MARKRTAPSVLAARTVTAERAARLYRLLKFVGSKPQTRESLMRRLRLDIRGFYRDLELLRAAGIVMPLEDRRYTLPGNVKSILSQLPFPDPRLTLGEAEELAKGRAPVHRKLKLQIAKIVR